jgi:hypothetical protein
MFDRERKVDLSKMSKEQVDNISAQLGERIRQICDKAVEEANRLCAVYGLRTKMQIVIDSPALKKEPLPGAKPPRARKAKKATQSLT